MSQDLITQQTLQQLTKQAQEYSQWLIINSWNLVSWFLRFLQQDKNKTAIPFSNFSNCDDKNKLQKIKELLIQQRKKTNHKYKKLHYTLIISKLTERIHELSKEQEQGKKEGKETLSALEKINLTIQTGDIMLISYRAHGTTRNDSFNNIVSDALRFFSHSMFAHVWLIGEKEEEKGYQRYHSTLSTAGGRIAWVQKLPLNNYLNEKKPCDILIVRYNGPDKHYHEKMLSLGKQYLKEWVKYDTGDAVGDIIGKKLRRTEDKVNCGEFIHCCLKAIDSKIEIEQHSLPSSYLQQNFLEQIYLTHYND